MINSYFVDFDNTVWLRTGSNPAVTDRFRNHTGKDFLSPLANGRLPRSGEHNSEVS